MMTHQKITKEQAEQLYSRIITEGNLGQRILDHRNIDWVICKLTTDEIDQISSLAYHRAEETDDPPPALVIKEVKSWPKPECSFDAEAASPTTKEIRRSRVGHIRCQNSARYYLNGKPACAIHAKAVALEHMLKGGG